MKYQDEHWDYMLRLAKASILHGFEHDAPLHASNRGVTAAYSARRGAYVGLTVHGVIRGCMGDIPATLALYDTIRSAAYRAAFGDDRFFPPGRGVLEHGRLQICVFIDTRSASISGLTSDDSILVEYQRKRAVVLNVYRRSRSIEEFLRVAVAKAGISRNVPLTELKITALRTESSSAVLISEIGEFKHEWF